MIEFDPAKDKANIAKHSVSLALADSVDLSRCTVVQDRRRDYGGERFTYRHENVRAISLRRARAGDIEKWQRK